MAGPDLSERLVDSLNGTYGSHPGARAAHAKGVLCAGSFVPSPEAALLSRAPHLRGPTVPAHIRFSSGSGNPTIPDATHDPRGMAVKLYVDGQTTDVVALSLPVFFARTPEDLLAFGDVRRPDPATGQPDPAKVGAYLAEHPEAVAAVTAAITHPIPSSYATLRYHGIHAFGFLDADGAVRHGRYRFVPDAESPPLSDEEAVECRPDHLTEELAARFARAPAVFHLDVQMASPGDPIDDPTAVWPEDGEVVRIGRLDITGLAHDRDSGDDVLVFDPTRVPEGIALTNDPILLARSGAYSVSVDRRRGHRAP